MILQIDAEIEKWRQAKDDWLSSPLKDAEIKARECIVIIKQLVAINAFLKLNQVNGRSLAARIIDYLKDNNSATTSKLMQFCNCKSQELKELLKSMINSGQIASKKSGNGHRYSLA